MQHIPFLKADCATDAFEKAYNLINDFGEVVESRIGKTKHIPDVTIQVDNPKHNICLNPQRNLSLKYVLGEMRWYMSGSNKVADIAPYAKMWNSLTDDGETVNSAYGYRIFHQFGFDQLQYCIDKLKVNPHDRQAVIHIKDASNKPTKDTPCTCLIQFTCFAGRLNAHVYMRSNDIWLGLPYDIVFFTTLQQIVAKATGLPLGRYFHTVGDLHLYEKHWDKGVQYSGDYDFDTDCWNFADETPEHVQEMIDGAEPKNNLLKRLWRLNEQCRRLK